MNQKLPIHIAIIMDGNGRWAADRNLPRIAGHRAGVDAVRRVVEDCTRFKIPYLTLFAFSTENWNRPQSEVGGLMVLLDQYLKKELRTLMKNNVRLSTIGQIDDLPANVRQTLRDVVEQSAVNDGLNLTLALSYSGRDDILEAVRRVATAVQKGDLTPDAIEPDTFSSFLHTDGMPDPDLLIRTSGEQRISNFLLWQIAYTEFYVTDKLWPDFESVDLLDAIKVFNSRERRFGKTSEQIRGEDT
ncbi:isoprenyl transferase [bacterium]|nr:isoprenyl transferase [bacterium]